MLGDTFYEIISSIQCEDVAMMLSVQRKKNIYIYISSIQFSTLPGHGKVQGNAWVFIVLKVAKYGEGEW